MDNDIRGADVRDDDIRLGVVLPTGKAQWGAGTDPRGLIEFAGRAEALGYASIWAGDTLLRPVIETFTMLSAAAAVTERVLLGTAALLPAFRRPVRERTGRVWQRCRAPR